MTKVKQVLLGLFVGGVAFFIYIVAYGVIAAYLPINYSEMTEGMTKEKATFSIQTFHVFEQFLATLPMAIAAYIFISILKFRASILFLVSSIAVFLSNYFYTIYEFGSTAFNIIFVMGVVLPCLMLCFTLSAPNKKRHKM